MTTDNSKILLVDDRPENIRSLQKSLKGCGAQCITAVSGNDALKEILVHDFALAILDVQMPEMDGFELARIIRDNKQTRCLPIIFLSAVYSDEFHIFKGYEAGGVDFINKPYEARLLQSKVKVFLDLHRHRCEQEKTNARLLQAEKLESIGILAGGIAHDFNNILTVILGNAELGLLDNELGVGLAAKLQQIKDAGKRAKELVGQILSYSRKSHAGQHPVLIDQILREAFKLLRSTLPQTVQLQLSIVSHEDKIMADPTQIHQVIMNLCTNSFHAMVDEKGRIEVSLGRVASEKAPSSVAGEPCLHLQVKDDGVGMNSEVLTTLFEPFFTTKPEGLGTGLGLTVVREVVNSCNGVITVSSKPGLGTTFDLYFPVTELEDLSEDVTDVSELPRGHGRILVVDDEQMVRSMLINMLEYLGYGVVTVSCGREALDVFQENPAGFTAVITDQSMPGMAGEELVPLLVATRPDIPIFLCSGHSARLNKERARELGARDYLLKPISLKSLARVLDDGCQSQNSVLP